MQNGCTTGLLTERQLWFIIRNKGERLRGQGKRGERSIASTFSVSANPDLQINVSTGYAETPLSVLSVAQWSGRIYVVWAKEQPFNILNPYSRKSNGYSIRCEMREARCSHVNL